MKTDEGNQTTELNHQLYYSVIFYESNPSDSVVKLYLGLIVNIVKGLITRYGGFGRQPDRHGLKNTLFKPSPAGLTRGSQDGRASPAMTNR